MQKVASEVCVGGGDGKLVPAIKRVGDKKVEGKSGLGEGDIEKTLLYSSRRTPQLRCT